MHGLAPVCWLCESKKSDGINSVILTPIELRIYKITS